MTERIKEKDVERFLEALGLSEEPMGMHYTEVAPGEGISPTDRCRGCARMRSREVRWTGEFFSAVSPVL